MLKGKPFVKWAGGKRQIIDKLKMYAPDEFNTYYEPFVGGGTYDEREQIYCFSCMIIVKK